MHYPMTYRNKVRNRKLLKMNIFCVIADYWKCSIGNGQQTYSKRWEKIKNDPRKRAEWNIKQRERQKRYRMKIQQMRDYLTRKGNSQ